MKPLRRVVAALSAGLVVATGGAGIADASPRSEADRVMDMTYQAFIDHKRDVTSVHGPYVFDWSDDGCSIPGGVPGGRSAADLFDKPCQLHDFGYRNYGRGLRLGRDEDTRAWIDHRFWREMGRLCDDKFSAWYRRANWATCQSDARLIYGAVRNFGRSAFYG